ncbi:hypothetical protein NDU88_004193, partial [Pleurodeles waltl]
GSPPYTTDGPPPYTIGEVFWFEDPDAAKDDGSPADMPVPEHPDDMDDELINIPQETIQEVLGILQTPPSVTSSRSTAGAGQGGTGAPDPYTFSEVESFKDPEV